MDQNRAGLSCAARRRCGAGGEGANARITEHRSRSSRQVSFVVDHFAEFEHPGELAAAERVGHWNQGTAGVDDAERYQADAGSQLVQTVQGRSAVAAEMLEPVGAGLGRVNFPRTFGDLQGGVVEDRIGCKCAAVHLAADAAMTVEDDVRLAVQRDMHVAAGTGAKIIVAHVLLLSRSGIGVTFIVTGIAGRERLRTGLLYQ